MSDDFDDGQWGSSNMDVVAEPVRYPRSPLVALLAVALLPVIALFVLYRWADGEADTYEASNGATGVFDRRLDGGLAGDQQPVTSEPTDDEIIDEPAVVLTTSILDFRRASETVASVVSAAQFQTAIEPVLGFVGPQSCVSVAVDGVAISAANPATPVVPASNEKLFVAATALEILGPDFRFTTSVAVPPFEDGTVDGDIYLIGGGDPLLTSDDFPVGEDGQPVINATSFDVLADGLVEAGVSRVRGAVIGDGTRYDDEWFVDEWAEDVAFIEAGPYDALIANDARVLGRFGKEGDPNEAAAREFVRLLADRGIQVDNGWGSGTVSNLVPVVTSVQSAPLSAVVEEMLLTSDDNTAELLLKEIGFAASGEGTRAAGLNAMNQTLAQLGVDLEGVTFRDGSGLSNQNRATCQALLDVVQLSRGTAIDSGLPVAGRSGTLAGEFADSEMIGRLRAKTGTLTGAKALAGLVDARAGTEAGKIEFVIVLNTPDASVENVYRALWTALGERFETYPSGPPAPSLGPR